MSIPENTTVLVIGGGPAGSYTASVLAREGLDVVLLDSDKFPRYHVGESMLASIRHFLKFVDLDKKFDSYGFQKKVGAVFKLNHSKREGWTEFLAAGGPNAYSWNVVRSESDYLMYKHAEESGTKVFDGVKVNSIKFVNSGLDLSKLDGDFPNPGQAVSASWTRKEDGVSGTIDFEYLVDASGRMGLVSTKYFKNRKFNQGLKNVASWNYWKNTGKYAPGTPRDNQPFFEALLDASGWCWTIPLHNGTMSVGVVQRQDLAAEKKKALGSPSGLDFYKESLKLAPNCLNIIGKNAELVDDMHHASDWSYSASSYASPNVRIVGDAGCFIDPYFSSGVHLALASGLSAAMTICAAKNGEVDELTAIKWHSSKVAEGYTRFLLVVMSALKQIRSKDEPVLSDWSEDGFDVAFDAFRPIIQGTADADVGGKLTQMEVTNTVNFCLNAFDQTAPEDTDRVMKKLEALDYDTKVNMEKFDEQELQILKNIRARQMLRIEDQFHVDNFAKDAIAGYVPNLKRGSLGLRPQDETTDKFAAPIVDLLRLVDENEAVGNTVSALGA